MRLLAGLGGTAVAAVISDGHGYKTSAGFPPNFTQGPKTFTQDSSLVAPLLARHPRLAVPPTANSKLHAKRNRVWVRHDLRAGQKPALKRQLEQDPPTPESRSLRTGTGRFSLTTTWLRERTPDWARGHTDRWTPALEPTNDQNSSACGSSLKVWHPVGRNNQVGVSLWIVQLE